MTVECGWDPAARPLPPKNVLPRCTLYLDFFFLFKWGWRIKARTSRSGSLPFSLLQGCREISRMQPLGPVYIPTLSVSRIPEGPAAFHLANQPPCWSGGLGLRSFQRHPKPPSYRVGSAPGSWEKQQCLPGGSFIHSPAQHACSGLPDAKHAGHQLDRSVHWGRRTPQ